MPSGDQGAGRGVNLPMIRLNLIYARARNGVIGSQGGMPWHLPEDLAHLKRTTLGAPVIMGRKTWDSLPPRFRPLPGRQNIVVTRNAHWQPEPPAADANAGALRADSLDAAVALCGAADEAWIIGGAELLALAAPAAERAIVTEIDAAFDGDTFVPELGPQWVEIMRENHRSASGLNFSFATYRNTKIRD